MAVLDAERSEACERSERRYEPSTEREAVVRRDSAEA